MKYMLLICDDEQAWAKLSEADRRDRHRRADPVGAHGHDRSPAARGGRGDGAGVRAALCQGRADVLWWPGRSAPTECKPLGASVNIG